MHVQSFFKIGHCTSVTILSIVSPRTQEGLNNIIKYLSTCCKQENTTLIIVIRHHVGILAFTLSVL